MKEEICPNCGETKKNLSAHMRFCRNKPPIIPPEEPKPEPPIETIKPIDPPKPQEPILKQTPILPPIVAPANTPSKKKWYQIFGRKKTMEQVTSPLELRNQKLPKWSIKESKPFLFNPKKRQRLTQLVFHSRRPPYQEFLWVDTDELVVSVGQKGYKLPSAIHSGIVHWDADNDAPLLSEFASKKEGGNVSIDPNTGEILGDESQTALKTGMIKNYYFMLGKLANMKGLFTNAGLIMLLQILCILAILGLAYLNIKSTEAINLNLQTIINQTRT